MRLSEEDKVAQLLKDGTPNPPSGIDYDRVASSGRRRRAVTRGAMGLAVASCVLAATFAAPAVLDAVRQQDPQVAASRGQVAEFQSLTYPVPAGWRVVDGTKPGGAAVAGDKVVSVGDWGYVSNASGSRQRQTVYLKRLFRQDQRYDFRTPPSAEAEPTTRNGQPGWLEVTAHKNTTLVTLALPWLNAIVSAEAPDERTARALVDRVVVPAPDRSPAWTAPERAAELTLTTWSGEGMASTVTDQGNIRPILAALRDLRPVTRQTEGCKATTWEGTYVLTAHRTDRRGEQTYLIRSDELCLQVYGPDGGAAELSQRLLSELPKAFDLSGR